jgi:hypothetical protein
MMYEIIKLNITIIFLYIFQNYYYYGVASGQHQWTK